MISNGVWVTMLTPFHEDGSLALELIPDMVSYYKQSCDGIFAVCQSSEMFLLSSEERIRLAKSVLKAAGKLPIVVSGHVADSHDMQLTELQEMAQLGASALVLVSNRLADMCEDDDVWIERMSRVIDSIPDIPLGIYECPYPYKRLMSQKLLRWCVNTGRFTFLKDTCCNSDLILERLKLLEGTEFKLFNANTATLINSLIQGGAGYSGVMANFHPDLYSWLIKHRLNLPEKAEWLQAMLTLMSWVEARSYPACAKLHMKKVGLDISTYCRNGSHERLANDSHEDIMHLMQIENHIRTELGI